MSAPVPAGPGVRWLDIAVNLESDRFDPDRDEVVERARAAGVRGLLLGASVEGSRRSERLAREAGWPFTAGVHPHAASTWEEGSADALAELLDRGAVAVGECGLDFHRDLSPRSVQERVFEAQLALAAERGLPVVLHQREALDPFLAILRRWRDRLPAAIAHCFTEGPQARRRLLDAGCDLGITGWVCDERRAGPLREALPGIPLDRLHLETDAPWLAPRDLRPRVRRNEPALLPHVARVVAGILGVELEVLRRATLRNAVRVFGPGVLGDAATGSLAPGPARC